MNSLCVLPMLSFAVERRWLVVGHVTNLLPLAPLSFRVPLSLCSPLPCTSHPAMMKRAHDPTESGADSPTKRARHMKNVVEEWVNRYAGPHDYKDVTIWTFDVNDVETTIREREADAMKEMALTDDEQHKLIGNVTRCARLRHAQYSTPSPSNMRHTSPRSTYTQRLSRSVSLAKPLLRYGEGAVTRTQRWFDCVSPSNGPLSYQPVLWTVIWCVFRSAL